MISPFIFCGHCDNVIEGEAFRIPECCSKDICASCVEVAKETDRQNDEWEAEQGRSAA